MALVLIRFSTVGGKVQKVVFITSFIAQFFALKNQCSVVTNVRRPQQREREKLQCYIEREKDTTRVQCTARCIEEISINYLDKLYYPATSPKNTLLVPAGMSGFDRTYNLKIIASCARPMSLPSI